MFALFEVVILSSRMKFENYFIKNIDILFSWHCMFDEKFIYLRIKQRKHKNKILKPKYWNEANPSP